jgi:putative component of membrane protein insertase Oxa1/YidC/SpoIIIJ protein YidD
MTTTSPGTAFSRQMILIRDSEHEIAAFMSSILANRCKYYPECHSGVPVNGVPKYGVIEGVW